jgi:hypothetical protein
VEVSANYAKLMPSALARGPGRAVADRRVSFDLLDFYHNESRLFGVDTPIAMQ